VEKPSRTLNVEDGWERGLGIPLVDTCGCREEG
jgi:hypothetical protein